MRLFAIILAFISLCLTGCSNTGNSTKKNAGVNTSLKYEKAPVITADTEVYNVMDFGAVGDGKKSGYCCNKKRLMNMFRIMVGELYTFLPEDILWKGHWT